MILPEFLSILPSFRAKTEAPRTPTAEELEEELPGVVALVEGLLARGEGDIYTKIVQAVERVVLTRVLRHTHGHQARASEILGINRSTLRQKLRDLGLSLDKVVTENPSGD
jgi:two-component system nitrogen regulation response regulator GlnG